MESIVRICLLMTACTFVTGDDVVNGVCDDSVSIPDPFKSCGDGFSSSSSGSACLTCPSNCLACLDMGNYRGGCSRCKTGYMLAADQLSCSICPSNCDICNSTDCFTCADGYAKANDGTCQKCPINCDRCNSTTCFTCTAGYAKGLDGTCQSCGVLAYKGCGTCTDLLNSTTKAVCLSLDQCSKVNCYHCNSPTECNDNSTVTSCPVESGYSCWVIKTNCGTGTCNQATVQTSYGCLNQTCSSPYTEETCTTQANGSRQCKRCCTTDKCNNPSGAPTYFNRGRGGHVIQVVSVVAAMLGAYFRK